MNLLAIVRLNETTLLATKLPRAEATRLNNQQNNFMNLTRNIGVNAIIDDGILQR